MDSGPEVWPKDIPLVKPHTTQLYSRSNLGRGRGVYHVTTYRIEFSRIGRRLCRKDRYAGPTIFARRVKPTGARSEVKGSQARATCIGESVLFGGLQIDASVVVCVILFISQRRFLLVLPFSSAYLFSFPSS
jgi:hypothetical protein